MHSVLPVLLGFFLPLATITVQSQTASLWVTNYFFKKEKILIACLFLFSEIWLWCSISDKLFITMWNSFSSYDCSLQVISALKFVDYILCRKNPQPQPERLKHTFKCWTNLCGRSFTVVYESNLTEDMPFEEEGTLSLPGKAVYWDKLSKYRQLYYIWKKEKDLIFLSCIF